MDNQRGSILPYGIAALLTISALFVGISQFSAQTVSGLLTIPQAQQAGYTAESGLSIAQTLSADDLDSIRTDANHRRTYTLPDHTTITLLVEAPTAGTYPVTILGTVNPHTSSEANCRLAARITPASTVSVGKRIINTSAALRLNQSAHVYGDVEAQSVTLNNESTITGDVYADSSITVHQNAVITGAACTQEGNVTLMNGAQIVGDVHVQGNLELNGSAKITGNVFVAGKITLKYGTTIDGDVAVTNGYANITSYGGTISGTVTALSVALTCAVGATPNPVVTTGNYTPLTLEQGKSETLSSGTHFFSTVQIKNGATLDLDISSGKPLTIATTGDVNFENGARIRIKTKTSGDFKSVSALNAAGDFDDAALIYLKSEGTIIVKLNESWYGTLFGRHGLHFEEGVALIGAYASPEEISVKHLVTLFKYVLADAAW